MGILGIFQKKKNFMTIVIKSQIFSHLEVYQNKLQLINILFSLINHNSHGGAIFASNTNLNLIFLFLTFHQCTSSLYGGAVCIDNSNSSKIRSICLIQNQGIQSCAILIHGHLKLNYFVDYNLTIETSTLDYVASAIFATTKLNFYNNNITNRYSSISISSLSTGTGNNENIGKFNIISNSYGQYFFSIQNSKNGVNTLITNYNFINLTSASSWILYAHFSTNPIFSECYFKLNSNVPITYLGSSISVNPTFLNCKFNLIFDQNYHSLISTISNEFNYQNNINFNSILFSFNQCWDYTLYISTENFEKIFPIPIINSIIIFFFCQF